MEAIYLRSIFFHTLEVNGHRELFDFILGEISLYFHALCKHYNKATKPNRAHSSHANIWILTDFSISINLPRNQTVSVLLFQCLFCTPGFIFNPQPSRPFALQTGFP